jgi:hypothetical protein
MSEQETRKFPKNEIAAFAGGAMAAMVELPKIADHAKKRLGAHDSPIGQADLEELLQLLQDAQHALMARCELTLVRATPGRLNGTVMVITC